MNCTDNQKITAIYFIPIIKETEYMCNSIARFYQLKELMKTYPKMNKDGAKELLLKLNPLTDKIDNVNRISHINQKNPEQFIFNTIERKIYSVNVHKSKIFKFKDYVSENIKMQFELYYRKLKNKQNE
jgi:hypothetical protein